MKAYIKPESATIALMENQALLTMSVSATSAETTDVVYSRRRQGGWDSSNWSNKEELTEE